MKTPPASRRSGRGKSAPGAAAVPLYAFIGYADLPAFRAATGAVGEAMRARGRKIELHPLLWRFEQLASRHWGDRAVAAAMEADVVVLASSSAAALTPEIDAWISRFLHRMQGRHATLVVITGPNDAWTISLEQPGRPQVGVIPAEPDARTSLVE